MPKRTNWEDTLSRWGAAPSMTEQDKCDNAINVVKRALAAHAPLAGKTLDVYAKGSYANRTNVRTDSDVDISVCYRDGCYSTYAPGTSAQELGYTAHTYTYEDLRRDVTAAIVTYFGDGATPDTVAISVHANTYRVDADVVPCYEHRWHYRQSDGRPSYHKGEWIAPPDRARILNWPEQNYANGVAKNERTKRRFKALSRVFKTLRNEMNAEGILAAKPIASFLIESLVYNVPDEQFGNDSLVQDARNVLVHLWNATKPDGAASAWYEVNGLKLLFGDGQKWTATQVNAFVQAAWTQMDFK